MDTNKNEIRKVLKLDVVAAFSKMTALISIISMVIAIVERAPQWYLLFIISSICIVLYMLRASFIKNRFKSYKVVNARIIGRTFRPFTNIRGTKFLTYSYEYESKTYTSCCTIATFGLPPLLKEGNLIRIAVITDNPQKTKIIDLFA